MASIKIKLSSSYFYEYNRSIVYQVRLSPESNCISYTSGDLINEKEDGRPHISTSLFDYMEDVIRQLKRHGKLRTSETYRAALNSFKKYRHGKDIALETLSAEIMKGFEAWHRRRGNTSNTISFYNRILRAVYNRAVEDELIENRRPFRRVYTGVDKTVKRALPLSIIKKIKNLDLSRKPILDYARDMFILSFMLRGMSFIDMAFLKKKDLRRGYITYRRRKTGQQLMIKWTKEMQLILNKYPDNTSGYLLPVIKRPGTKERYVYRNVSYNINHSLKKIAGMVGIEIPLTMYVARHSWASAAKKKGFPLSLISEGMGHDNEATTQIYLTQLDTAAIDRANASIISEL